MCLGDCWCPFVWGSFPVYKTGFFCRIFSASFLKQNYLIGIFASKIVWWFFILKLRVGFLCWFVRWDFLKWYFMSKFWEFSVVKFLFYCEFGLIFEVKIICTESLSQIDFCIESLPQIDFCIGNLSQIDSCIESLSQIDFCIGNLSQIDFCIEKFINVKFFACQLFFTKFHVLL
jgi:hypothetical protein